jgi:hypothetical protein
MFYTRQTTGYPETEAVFFSAGLLISYQTVGCCESYEQNINIHGLVNLDSYVIHIT